MAALRRQAERDHGGPLERVVLTVPASYHHDPCWAAMIEVGELAGFAEVEPRRL